MTDEESILSVPSSMGFIFKTYAQGRCCVAFKGPLFGIFRCSKNARHTGPHLCLFIPNNDFYWQFEDEISRCPIDCSMEYCEL